MRTFLKKYIIFFISDPVRGENRAETIDCASMPIVH